jgi:hypothetical protein
VREGGGATGGDNIAPSGFVAGSGGTAAEAHYDFLVKVTRRSRSHRQSKHNRGAADAAADTAERKEAVTAPLAAAPASSLSSPYEIRAQVLGSISTSVNFSSLSDFQLLHDKPPLLEPNLPLLTSALPVAPAAANAATTSAASTTAGDGAGAGTSTDQQSQQQQQQQLQQALAAHFLDNNPGTRYDAIAPLMFSRHSYAREYAFANHDNAQALVRAAQDKFHAAALAAGKLSSAAEGTARPILSVKDSKAFPTGDAIADASAAGSSARPMEDVAPSTEPSPSPAPAAAASAAAASEAESATEDAGGHKKRHPRRFFEDYKKCTSMFFFLSLAPLLRQDQLILSF